MASKHYDIDYLQKSRQLLLSLKEQSYAFFNEISNGTIIDLGCGTGKDVIELAKVVGEKVKIIGIDHDPVMLQQAKDDSVEVSNVDFKLSEAWPLPFEDESISGLRNERLIQHLTNPEQVIQEINRILIKGSPFVTIETDWPGLAFYTQFTDIQKKLSAYLTDVKINNGFAARKLTGYLQAANFKNIKFEIHPLVITNLDQANELFWIEKMVKEASDKGYLTAQEYNTFYNALQKADDGHYFACSINLVMASCTK